MIERLTMMTVRSIHGNGNTRNDSPESSHLGVRNPMNLHGSIIEENCNKDDVALKSLHGRRINCVIDREYFLSRR